MGLLRRILVAMAPGITSARQRSKRCAIWARTPSLRDGGHPVNWRIRDTSPEVSPRQDGVCRLGASHSAASRHILDMGAHRHDCSHPTRSYDTAVLIDSTSRRPPRRNSLFVCRNRQKCYRGRGRKRRETKPPSRQQPLEGASWSGGKRPQPEPNMRWNETGGRRDHRDVSLLAAVEGK
jgi:hypothetical protein